MGRRADHCAYSLLSAGATNAVPRAQERGDGAGVGLHTLLHLCHLRPRAQAGMFPLSSHHAVSYQPLSETVYPHSSEAYKQHCCACLPDQTLSRQTEQGPIWVSQIRCGEGALMMLLVMEPRAGEIQAQPGEQDFSWGRGSVRGGGSPPSPCRPTFSLPLRPPNPALHLLLSGPGMQPTQEHIWHPTPSLAASSKTTLVNIFPREHVVVPTATFPPSRSCENRQMCTGFSAAPGNLRQGPVDTPGPKTKQRPRARGKSRTDGRWPLGAKGASSAKGSLRFSQGTTGFHLLEAEGEGRGLSFPNVQTFFFLSWREASPSRNNTCIFLAAGKSTLGRSAHTKCAALWKTGGG